VKKRNVDREKRVSMSLDEIGNQKRKIVAQNWLPIMLQPLYIEKLGAALTFGRRHRNGILMEVISAMKIQRRVRLCGWYFRFKKRRFDKAVLIIQRGIRGWLKRKHFKQNISKIRMDEEHETYEQKQQHLLLKVVIWVQGQFRVMQARKETYKRQFDDLVRHCQEYRDFVESHERTARAAQDFNSLQKKNFGAAKISSKASKLVLEPHLRDLRKAADQKTIFYIAENADSFDDHFVRGVIGDVVAMTQHDHASNLDGWSNKRKEIEQKLAFIRRVETARALVIGAKGAADARNKGLAYSKDEVEDLKAKQRHETNHRPRVTAILSKNMMLNWIKKACIVHTATLRLRKKDDQVVGTGLPQDLESVSDKERRSFRFKLKSAIMPIKEAQEAEPTAAEAKENRKKALFKKARHVSSAVIGKNWGAKSFKINAPEKRKK